MFRLLFMIIAVFIGSSVFAQSQEDNLQKEENLQEMEQSFQDFEKEFKSNIRSLLNSFVPYLGSVSPPENISRSCIIGLFKVGLGTRLAEEWAMKIFDSTGKITVGMLEGTAMALGDYDECQNVVIGGNSRRKKSQVGSYCLVEMRPSKVILDAIKEYQNVRTRSNSSLAKAQTVLGVFKNVKTNPDEVAFRIGVCMPSACSVANLQDIINIAAAGGNFPTVVKRCEVKKEMNLELHHEIILGLIGVFLLLVALSSLLELCLPLFRKDLSDETQENHRRFRWLLAFSIFNNTKELMKCDLEGDALDPIRGIKVITVIMTIFLHTYALLHPLHIYRYSSAFNFLKFTEDFSFSMIANSSAGIETFFFIAGFLSIYLRWRHQKNSPVCGYMAKFVFLNMFRMIFSQLLVICLFMLLPLVGSGPLFQDFVEEPLDNCKNYWWSNLLFIQNFWKPYDACLYQTWILAVMMQLILFTAVTVYVLNRWPLLGIGTNIFITIVAGIIVAVVTCVSDFPATFSVYFYDYRTALIMWKYLFVQAYNHAGPYCVGALVAYFCAVYRSYKLSSPLIILGWCSSIGTLLSIIYGLYDYRDGQIMHRALAVFYSAVHRPAWAVAVGWIVFVCSSGNGGVVNSILSWKAFVPMERLCYLVYLVHVPIMYFYGGVQREKLHMNHFNQVMLFISYTFLSFIVSYVCYIVFQAPYAYFENLIFGGYQNGIWQVEPSTESEKNLKEEENNSTEEIGSIDALFSKTNTNVSVMDADDA